MKSFYLLIIVLLALAAPALAQDNTPEYACEVDEASRFVARVEMLMNVIDREDISDILLRFEQMREFMAAARSVCTGYHFTGTGNEVFGPVRFVEGVYVVMLEGDRPAAQIAEVTGRCSAYVSVDRDTTRKQEIFRVREDCRAMIEISRVAGEWTLSFERVD